MTLGIFSTFSSLLLIIFFLVYSLRNQEKKLWVIFAYVISSTVSDVALDIAKDKKDRFFIFSSFTIIEYTFFALFFFLTFSKKTYKHLILVSYPLFYAIAVYNMLNPPPSYSFDSLVAPAAGILIIIFTILFFYEQLNNPSVIVIYSTKEFWIIIAFLIYASATLFFFITVEFLTESESRAFWPINDLANILKNILFAIAFSIPSQALFKRQT